MQRAAARGQRAACNTRGSGRCGGPDGLNLDSPPPRRRRPPLTPPTFMPPSRTTFPGMHPPFRTPTLPSGATLHAMVSLDRHFISQFCSPTCLVGTIYGDEACDAASRQRQWANPMGKAFLTVPYYLAGVNPGGRVPLLFDHILPISTSARQSFQGPRDVLPLFDASNTLLPDDGVCIVTTTATLDVAFNHELVVTNIDQACGGPVHSR